MEKCLFDSHSHLSDEAFLENHDNFIKSIEDSLVLYCMDIGTNEKTSLECIQSAKKYDFCYATVGFHPSDIKETFLADSMINDCLSAYLTEEKVVAIGEIGLDYHYDDGPSKEDQKVWFSKQIDWAVEHDAPICIHSRDADEDTFNILKAHNAFKTHVLMHCYSGSW